MLGQGREKPLSSLIPIVAALMVLSPASGLLFEIALATVYGTSATVDAFRVAYLVIGLGSQLFVGLVLPNALIPVLARSRADGREEEGRAVAVLLVVAVGLLSIPLVAAALVAPGPVIDLLGPGLDAAARAEGVSMVRAFSLIFFSMILLGAINCVLNVHRVFGLTHVNQIMINLLTVAVIFSIGRQVGGWAISIGMLAGALVGLAIGLVQLRGVTSGGSAGFRGNLFRPDLAAEYRKIAAVVVPLLALAVAGQWQVAIVNRVLSELPSGALATFGYAYKMTAMVGILPLALATVVFPSLSELWGGEDHAKARRLSTRAITFTLLLIFPIVTLLSFAAKEAVAVVFQHGALTDRDVDAISAAFLILVWSAMANAFNALMMKISYSARDGYGPLVQTLLLAVLATVLAAPFARLWGVNGVTALLTLSHTVLMAGYFIYLQLRYRVFELGYLADVGSRILISAAVAAALTTAFLAGVGDLFGQHFWGRLGKIIALSCVFVPAFGAAAYILKVPELATVIGLLLRGARRVTGIFA